MQALGLEMQNAACRPLEALIILSLLSFSFLLFPLPSCRRARPVVLSGLCSRDISDCVIHSDNYTERPPAASPLPVAHERRLHSKVKLFCAASKAPLSRCVRRPCSPAAHLIRRLPPSGSPAPRRSRGCSLSLAATSASWLLFFCFLFFAAGGQEGGRVQLFPQISLHRI